MTFSTNNDVFVCLWNNYYLVSSSVIDSLLAFLFMLFRFLWIFVARMCVAVFTISDFFVWLWHSFYHISGSLIDSLFAYFFILFLSFWIILVGMLLTVLLEVISLYFCEMIIILYPVHWLIHYFLRSVCYFFSFAML